MGLNQLNRRVLIVDDNSAIHADFRKILCPDKNRRPTMGEAASALFGGQTDRPEDVSFELDFASQGEQALDLVRATKTGSPPYMIAFIDVRMPPGWDRIETAAKIWETDPDLQVILCTAYSDHSWHQIAARLNRPDKFVILKKPFDSMEVLQLANAFIAKRHLQQKLETHMSQVEESELRRRTILNAIPHPVLVANHDLRVLDSNHAARAMFLPQHEQATPCSGGSLMHCIHCLETPGGCGHSPTCQTCIIRNAVSSVIAGTPVSRRKAEIELQTPDRTKRVDMLVTTAPIELFNQQLALLILEDVTELVALRSMLPICAHCKSIRNDQRYWQSIESYLHTHMNLDFSHGLCPKCTAELYPDIYKKMVANRVKTKGSDSNNSD